MNVRAILTRMIANVVQNSNGFVLHLLIIFSILLFTVVANDTFLIQFVVGTLTVLVIKPSLKSIRSSIFLYLPEVPEKLPGISLNIPQNF